MAQPVTVKLTERFVISGGSAGSSADDAEAARRRAKREPAPRFTVTKLVRGQGNWLSHREIDVSEMEASGAVVRFRIMAINGGNAGFLGEMSVYDHLPQGGRLVGAVSVNRVVDQRDGKSALSLVPFLSFMALAINDLSVREQIPATVRVNEGGLLEITIPSASIASREGVALEFDVAVPGPPPLREDVESH